MGDYSEAFVGIDTSKLRNAVAIADAGRGGEVRFLGEIENTPASTAKLVRKLAARYKRLTFCANKSLLTDVSGFCFHLCTIIPDDFSRNVPEIP